MLLSSGIQPLYGMESHYSVWNWFQKCWRNGLNFDGRARRKEFWSFMLVYLFVNVLGAFLYLLLLMGTAAAPNNQYIVVPLWAIIGLVIFALSLLSLVLLIPMVSVSVRRLHDISLSGWWLLLYFIPVANLALWVMFCIDTKPVTNQWGAPARSVQP